MALSETVKNSLEEAQSSLKNALSFSARQEDSKISVEIAHLIQSIDAIMGYDILVDLIKKQADNFKNNPPS
jgi:hypothetical protein